MQAISQPVRIYANNNFVHKDNAKSPKTKDFEQILTAQTPKNTPYNKINTAKQSLVFLGSISKENPTVSHLLIKDPNYGSKCWDIVHSSINQNKDFRNLHKGDKIWLDPQDNEILWGSDLENKLKQGSSFLQDLSQAVSAYKGTPYNKLNCYELVVKGLEDMGIKYNGTQGMQGQLIQKALQKGLPLNAYLTGEGLLQVSSTPIYKNTFYPGKNPEDHARKAMEEVSYLIEPGMILSFSTSKQGHVGVVSKHGNKWTFINSGQIDNSVQPTKIQKGVGEEVLLSELENWFSRAQKADEKLQISIGRLSKNKLAAYLDNPQNELT